MTSIQNLLRAKAEQLSKAGITNAQFEVRILLAYITGFSESYIIGHSTEELSKDIIQKFDELIKRRQNHEPIAYILREKEFYGRNFRVTEDVLVPRSDTETLIEAVIGKYSGEENLRILDLGVGSGCILITLLLELSNSSGFGVDISEKALAIADENVANHQVQARCNLIVSDWFEKVGGKFDIIISNPPYIAKNETNLMAKETLEHEPETALFAEENGLENYKIIASNAKNFLAKNGRIFIEIGLGQAQSIQEIFIQNGYVAAGIYNDLSGHIRCLEFMILG